MEQQQQRWDPENGVSGTASPEVGSGEWSGKAAAELGPREWSEWNSSSRGGTQRMA